MTFFRGVKAYNSSSDSQIHSKNTQALLLEGALKTLDTLRQNTFFFLRTKQMIPM